MIHDGKHLLRESILLLLCIVGLLSFDGTTYAERVPPNFIVILADDLGYGDLSCFGADDIATPNIDRMASDGAKLTSCYVSSVCSPTRASLMTGCYPARVGIGGVLFPRNDHGLNPEEITLPELLKQQGYTTAIIGKWHLGNADMFQPMEHGFDYWFGTPSSNSQFFYPKIKAYSDDCVFRNGYSRDGILELETAECPLIRNNVVIEVPADQTQFTKRYTRETIRFITDNKDRPFFVYLAHNMPHIPLHASDAFRGTSQRGVYGDAIQEMDSSTGEILQCLKDQALDRSTLVIFTSDNGPNTDKGGSAGILKGGKGTTWEGGVRVPFIARWPGEIPVGTESDEAVTVMDLLPTLVGLAGGELPRDRAIDGNDIWPLLAGRANSKSPHEAVYYLRGRKMQGIRMGEWKYRVATDKPVKSKGSKRSGDTNERAKRASVETLYQLQEDPGEQQNLIELHPDVAARLRERMEAFDRELRQNTRPAGVAKQP